MWDHLYDISYPLTKLNYTSMHRTLVWETKHMLSTYMIMAYYIVFCCLYNALIAISTDQLIH